MKLEYLMHARSETSKLQDSTIAAGFKCETQPCGVQAKDVQARGHANTQPFPKAAVFRPMANSLGQNKQNLHNLSHTSDKKIQHGNVRQNQGAV
jgi:hypothetical protein